MIINNKEFNEIPGYKDYFISRDGEVYSKKRNIILSQCIGKYNFVTLYIDKKMTTQTIHKLLGLTYIPLPIGYTIEDVLHNKEARTLLIDHIDGDKLNDDLSNLRWLTSYQNSHAGNHLGPVGAKIGNNNAKNHKYVKGPRYYYTYKGNDYKSAKEVAKVIGCSVSKITESFRKNYGLVKQGILKRRIR